MKLLNRLRPRVIFFVILVIYLDGFLLISPTAEINAAYRGISGSSILVEHDYDPISDSVVSWSLKAGESIGQSFTVPSGITSVDGFCVKLLRVGPVPPLEYQIENKWGDGNLSSGKILSNDVEVFFERWVRVNLSRPVRVEPGRQYYIHLHAANGPEAGYYELFGTASARIDKPNFKMKFQDVPAWGNAPSAPSGFENPINLDYGMKTPRYEGGAAISADGTLIEPLDFAIRILGQKSKGKDVASRNDSSPVAKDREGIASPEERFSFIDELLAPPHEKSIRVGSSLRSNEFELTRD
ncbi:MAG: hypothetical protein J2P41_19665, partial [Blastocatellia bacterium]|nr:hypothetical protein [Blastocatellia bacterium]